MNKERIAIMPLDEYEVLKKAYEINTANQVIFISPDGRSYLNAVSKDDAILELKAFNKRIVDNFNDSENHLIRKNIELTSLKHELTTIKSKWWYKLFNNGK